MFALFVRRFGLLLFPLSRCCGGISEENQRNRFDDLGKNGQAEQGAEANRVDTKSSWQIFAQRVQHRFAESLQWRVKGAALVFLWGSRKGHSLPKENTPCESPREARQSITVFAVRIYCNYHAQRRALAREVCTAYAERLKADPSYRKVLYKELADYWHRNNRKNRGKLEPLSYFDKLYKLRGKNREKALKLGYPTEYDRLALRATSVFHLAHWRDDVSVASYVTAR